MEYYSAISKKENANRSNMDGPKAYHAKWSKPKKDKYQIISLICVIQNKNYMNELIYKTEIDSQT